ncbi:MAG: dTDP-4-dehydrorhamnose reductase [Cyanobacteria bacterium P01_C01_bin.120]
MKILLIGSQGQVGQELLTTLPTVGPVTAWGRADLDLTQLADIAPQVIAQQPDVIVNAAAYTAVDKAESEPELAHAINGEAPKRLAQAAQACGATLVQLSTDYVFDGQQNRPYQPTAPTQPLGVYGQSKLVGEQAVRSGCDRHIIMRTAWVYGAKGAGNFVKTMLRVGAERETLKVVYDQVGCPTWSYDIAAALAALIPRVTASTYGIYHFTNSGAVSWYDFAVAIFEEAAALGWPLRVKTVLPITTNQYPTAAQRPAYAVLAGDKLAAVLHQTAPHWRVSLRKMLAELMASTRQQPAEVTP